LGVFKVDGVGIHQPFEFAAARINIFMGRLLCVPRRIMVIENRGGGMKLRGAAGVVNCLTIVFVCPLYYKGSLLNFLSKHKHKEVHDGVQG